MEETGRRILREHLVAETDEVAAARVGHQVPVFGEQLIQLRVADVQLMRPDPGYFRVLIDEADELFEQIGIGELHASRNRPKTDAGFGRLRRRLAAFSSVHDSFL